MTSTRSFGRMKPPAPVSGEICVETARMPVGRIAAMKPEPFAFTSFASRIGSPATKGARTIMPERFSKRFGLIGLADEIAGGGGRRPGLPRDICRRQRLASGDVTFGHQECRRCRTWAPRPWAPAACPNGQPAWRQRHPLPERQSGLRHVQLSYAHSHHDRTAGLAA